MSGYSHYRLPFGGCLAFTILKGPSLLPLRLEKFLNNKEAAIFNLIVGDLLTAAKLWTDIDNSLTLLKFVIHVMTFPYMS